MSEVRVHALHILQSEFNKVIGNMEVVRAIKACGGYPIAMSKNPMLYVSTIVFLSKKERMRFAIQLDKLGIKYVVDFAPCYVDSKYL